MFQDDLTVGGYDRTSKSLTHYYMYLYLTRQLTKPSGWGLVGRGKRLDAIALGRSYFRKLSLLVD